MFQSKKYTNANYLLNHIHVFSERTSCKFFPNLGASIQELIFDNVPVIHGVEISEQAVSTYQILYNSALLFPFPGRIENGKYSHNEQTYQLNINDPHRFNAIHGLVFDKPFEIEAIESSNENAKVRLSYVSDGKLEGFPFKFVLTVTYLISTNTLQLSIDIKNLDKNPFPFGMGWHPYFKSVDLNSSSLSFSSEKQLVCNENLIPKSTKMNNQKPSFKIENQTFDDTFILLKKKVIFNTDRYTLDIIFSETSQAIMQIYTPPDRESIAIEPMSCCPNAFNTKSDLKILQPNETFNWQVGLNFRAKN